MWSNSTRRSRVADRVHDLCERGIIAANDEQNWDKAVDCFGTAKRLLGREAYETLVKNLSACLNARAVKNANEALKLLEERHKSVFDKAVHGYGF